VAGPREPSLGNGGREALAPRSVGANPVSRSWGPAPENRTNWTALASGVADKVFLYYAPRILAGTGSVPFAAGHGFRKMSEAAHLKSFRLHRFGEDFAVEGYLRDPYLD